MSSKFIFEIKIPVLDYDDREIIINDEREASEICEQRDLNFSRIAPEEYLEVYPVFIFCIVEIQGLSVFSQYSKSCFL